MSMGIFKNFLRCGGPSRPDQLGIYRTKITPVFSQRSWNLGGCQRKKQKTPGSDAEGF